MTVKDITYLNNKCIFKLYRTKDLWLAHVLREGTACCIMRSFRVSHSRFAKPRVRIIIKPT